LKNENIMLVWLLKEIDFILGKRIYKRKTLKIDFEKNEQSLFIFVFGEKINKIKFLRSLGRAVASAA